MTTIGDAMKDYVLGLTRCQTEQTVATYSQGIARFKEFLIAKGLQLTSPASVLDLANAIEFSEWLSGFRENKKAKLASSTQHTYLTSIFGFYKFLVAHEIIESSASGLERLRMAFHNTRRGRRPLPKLPPEEAVNALLDAARHFKEQPKHPRLELARLRNIAMLQALRSSGM